MLLIVSYKGLFYCPNSWVHYRAAIAALAIQGVLGFFMAVLYTFYFTPEFFPQFGAGFGLVLLGFIVMSVGTFLK